jgi:DTW domain-containing protein
VQASRKAICARSIIEYRAHGPYMPGMTADAPLAPEDQVAECPRCGKQLALCVCEAIAPIANKIALLILQHPQEQDKTLGTARLTALHFSDATLKVGLSWASLAKALGRPADPQRWGVLYLGSVRAAALDADAEIVAVDRKGEAEERQQALLRSLEGVVLLDGTWSQAKALWWRNPWMLKCRRIVLNPARPSRYGKLRREPRSDGLSTLEAAGLLLSRLERRAEIEGALLASFDRLLTRYRELQVATPDFDRVRPGEPRPGRAKQQKYRRAKAMHRRR